MDTTNDPIQPEPFQYAAADICPVCQVGHLKATQTTYVQVYDGTLVSVPNVLTWKCDVCGSSQYDPGTIRRLEVMIGEAGPPPNHHSTPAPTVDEKPEARPDDRAV
jgi:YgiT-type zinc finger domain-containing protein